MSNSYKFSFLVLVLILLSQISAATQEVSFRIFNGESCDITRVPFLVIILAKKTCGGCLITYRLVLSAAHCMLSKDYGVNSIVLSSHMLPKLQQVRYFKDVYRHPNFDELTLDAGTELRYDIGIIVVNEPFVPSVAVQVVKLPHPGYSDRCNQAMVTGIGLTSNDPAERKTLLTRRPLNCANLSIIDIHTCQKSYPKATLDDTIICTNQTERDSCEGDSGGPLTCNNYVIGVVSYGSKPCAGVKSATYSKVEKFLNFIGQIRSQYPEILPKSGGVNVSISEKASMASANTVHVLVVNGKFVQFTLLYWFVLIR